VTKYILVLNTVPQKEQGEKIAKALVAEKLAACVTISGPSDSHYRWEGKICHDQEFILFIKTKASLFEAVKNRIAALHPYEVPEIIALPVADGFPDYLRWVDEETKTR
jgi:periplasmic divalent cation tolerance protein